jgi:prepilin-type N-terminal cleavage/methylation domain-containing protein
MARNMKRGFSLTELIVSMVVIALGLLTLATLLSISRKSLIRNDVRARGVEYLQDELELFEEMGYEEIVSSFHDGVQYDASEGLPGGYSRLFWIFYDDPIPGMARVRISVSWEEEQRTWLVKTETYITRK